MIPPNLKELFGDRYRIGHDPIAQTRTERNDPWMMALQGKRGIIYPHDENRLAVECRGSHARKILSAVPGATVHQRGETEWTILFDVADFDIVATIIRPKKRPAYTQEQRLAMSERMKTIRGNQK